MFQQTRQFLALFISVVILLTGHGLQLTLLPLQAEFLGWPATALGLTGSAYFAGFLAGCFLIPIFITRVGHIRVFSSTTTLCGAMLLILALSDSYIVWAGLRFLTGVGISGCYIVIESWLNAQSSNDQRGRTLALYSMFVLAAMTLGQVFVTVAEPGSFAPFAIGSVLLSCSVIPLTLTRIEQPIAPARVHFSIKKIYAQAPAAVGTSALIGAATGALFTLTPSATLAYGFSISQTAQIMMAIVVGGAALQYPAGRLSDRVDRRKVMLMLASLGALTALAAVFSSAEFIWFLISVFLFGGAVSAIYPLSLSHANDRLPGEFLEVGTAVLLANSLGAIVGPLACAALIDLFGANGYFYFMVLMTTLVGAWLSYCLMQRSEHTAAQRPHVVVVKSTPEVMQLDPRDQHEPDTNQD